MRAREIWRTLWRDGTIDRAPYLLIGVALTPLKYSLDAIVAAVGFDRAWLPWDYFVSGSTLSTLVRVMEDRAFFLTLLALSLPFVYIGVTLTLARLRSAGLSPWLVILFFAPVLNLVLLLVLVIWPPKLPEASIAQGVDSADPRTSTSIVDYGKGPTPARAALARMIPASMRGSFWMAAGITVAVTLGLTFLSVNIFSSYGWGVFVGTPFVGGLIAAVLHSLRGRRTVRQCVGVAVTSMVLATILFFVFAIDGLVCILMYLPLAIPLAACGGAVGYMIQLTPPRPAGARLLIGTLILFVPLFMGAEKLSNPTAPVFAVTTSLDIDAPPERVWQNVIAFAQIPPPTQWLFRVGVAYPVRATIAGRGVGAVRHCEFSTGTFVEPITVWDAPRLLKFDVTANPSPMKELSLYDIHPNHTHDFLISHGGQFHLVPLGEHCTRLEGTTWYEHNMWPAGYWRLWSDFIIHRIHLRVLEHIKQVSERPIIKGQTVFGEGGG